MTHTPLPWKVGYTCTDQIDFDNVGTFAGLNWGSGAPNRLDPDEQETFEANAAYIVKSANAYPELVKTLKACIKTIDLDTFEAGGHFSSFVTKIVRDTAAKLLVSLGELP